MLHREGYEVFGLAVPIRARESSVGSIQLATARAMTWLWLWSL